MKKRIAIIIPSYSEKLTANEKIALSQVKKILGKYDIYFILPNSVQIDYSCAEIIEKRYSDDFFSSIRQYSKFMLQTDLYEDFSCYDYILIYQLDAFVFEDNIHFFCDLNYDYIGAPWVKGVYFRKNENEKVWYVGNGGLSLRKVDAFLKWTRERSFEQYMDYINEDLLISVYGAPILSIAPIDVALSFSFEADYDQCIKLTEGRKPFGCHGWERYDFKLWKKVIERQGYKVERSSREEIIDSYSAEMNAFCRREFMNDEMEKLFPFLCKNNGQEMYIWGTGLWGISLMQKLLENNMFIKGFIDSDPTKWGKNIFSYKIFPPTILKEEKEKVIIAIKRKYAQIERLLQEYGYKKQIDYNTLQDMLKMKD